jgi:hypothetical protein
MLSRSHRSVTRSAAPTTSVRRVSIARAAMRLPLALLCVVGAACAAMAEDKPVVIYVDTTALDDAAFPNLSTEDTNALKSGVVSEIQAKFDAVLGAGVVTITNDPAKKTGASRTVTLKDDYGLNSQGKSFYGGWSEGKNGQPGSDAVWVYLGNFADWDQDHYKKSDGTWDVSKLKRGLGATASHELAHSFSVGHNVSPNAPKTLMNDGTTITPAERAANDRGFDEEFVKKTLKNNIRSKPCVTAQNFTVTAAIKPTATGTPQTPSRPDDVGSFAASLATSGALAPHFVLGWYGADSDDGADGSDEFDFIYKTSLSGDPEEDAPWITFFESQHSFVQLLLRGLPGTTYAGMWFPMDPALVSVTNPTTTPDGLTVYQLLSVAWNIDAIPGTDVQITLNAANVYQEPGGEYNGWTIVPAPASALTLAFGALGVSHRRRRS